jgi:hypothetical protein
MDVSLKIKHSFIDEAVSLIFGSLIFLTLRPYFIWESKFIYSIVFFSAIAVTLVWCLFRARISKNSVVFISVFLSSFFLNQFTLHGAYPWISVIVVLILCFLLFDEKIYKNTLKVFINIYVLVSIPSIVMFFLLAAGVNLEWEYLEPYSKAKQLTGVYYREYFGMVVLNTQIFTLGVGELFRLSSVFPEPGVVGTVSALLLAVTRFDVKNWKGVILLVSGILSFSLAFYVLACVYLIFKKPFYLFILVGLLSAIFIYLPDDIKDNRIIKYYVMERGEALFVNFDKVDNRIDDCFERHYDEFLNSSNIFIGNGYKASISTMCNVSSYKTIIYDYGIIGFLILVLLYTIILLSKIRTKSDFMNCVPLLIVFLATSYQRPAFDTFWFFAIFLGGIISLVNSKSNVRDRGILQ